MFRRPKGGKEGVSSEFWGFKGEGEGKGEETYTTLGTAINLCRIARVIEHTAFVVVSATNTVPLAFILSSYLFSIEIDLLHFDSHLNLITSSLLFQLNRSFNS
jgi:hypothetical protein